jgi:hypothetical protein
MADSARLMGVTVVMGALTTLGAGMFLWMCTLTFFTKFAVRKPTHFMIIGALVYVTVGGLVTVHNQPPQFQHPGNALLLCGRSGRASPRF